MGAQNTKLEKPLLASSSFPESERFFGLVNYGNTCYCNSVLQALYACHPFREQLIDYWEQRSSKSEERAVNGRNEEKMGNGKNEERPMNGKNEERATNLLATLAELFAQIAYEKRKTGSIAPKKFIEQLRKESEIFCSHVQQDAHEFLSYLLNLSIDILQGEQSQTGVQQQKQLIASAGSPPPPPSLQQQLDSSVGSPPPPLLQQQLLGPSAGSPPLEHTHNSSAGNKKTFIHNIFEGTLTTETRCNCCETVSHRDESFLDLSIDVSQNSSIAHCLNNFSSIETLKGSNKFFCDTCCTYQEAQKSMKIFKLPQVLILHLKRFKFFEHLKRHKKLPYRVAFPFELRIPNAIHDEEEKVYELAAIVVHIGYDPNMGHYKCIVRSNEHWVLFDDDAVDSIQEHQVLNAFGFPNEEHVGRSETAYILLYMLKKL